MTDTILAVTLVALFAVGITLGYHGVKASNRMLDEVIAEAENTNPDPDTAPWSKH